MIRRCRSEVEGRGKAAVRRLALRYVRARHSLAEVGEGFQWGRELTVGVGSRIGRYAYLGPGFASQGPVTLGDLCMIAAQCRIVGADHLHHLVGTPARLGWPTEPRRPTVFGADAWVGERTTLLEGVSVGTGAVIGAASLVLKDVAPYTIVAGCPARYIRDRFEGVGERDAHDRTVRGEFARTAE